MGGQVSGSKESSANYGILFTMCALPFILVAIAVFYFYRKAVKHDKLLEELIGYLRLYRRISLQKISADMGIPVTQTSELLLEAISRGMIDAHIDRETGEVFVQSAVRDARVENIRCPNCGAIVSGVYLIGEAVKCPYCNTVFKVEE
jgi:DNA-directed RNA polymerase subunit RPC12/RpoP